MASAGSKIKQALDAADQAVKDGDVARAVSMYRAILTKVPKHTKAKKALARLEKNASSAGMTQADANYLSSLLNSGNLQALLSAALDMSRRFRNDPFLFNVLGYAHSALGETKESIAAYKWAIKLNPNFYEAYSNYGSMLNKLDRFDDAIAILKKGLSKNPNYAETHHNLGVAYFGKGELDVAESHYSRAIALQPKYANALNSRGSLFMSRSDYPAAYEDFAAAEAIDPRSTLFVGNKMAALVSIGRSEEALRIAEVLVEMDPNDPEYRLRYSIQLNELGRKNAAIASLERLLELVPNHSVGLRVLSSLYKDEQLNTTLHLMSDLIAEPDVLPDAQVHLGFGLGLALEKTGAFADSAEYLKIANDANADLLNLMPDTDENRFATINALIDAGVFGTPQVGASQSDVPILIVGLMRSGTSLVEQIVASHSSVFGAGERAAVAKLSKPFYQAGTDATAQHLSEFAQAYVAELQSLGGEAARVVDKMPENFFHIGLIKRALPNAKIINLVRDPRDACFSIYKNYFDTNAHHYAYDQRALAAFANDYKRLMDTWDAVMPDAVIHVRYEDLVADQEGESRKLLDRLGLPWEDSVLNFHETKRSVRTASVNQVRQKIYASSVKNWEPYAPYLGELFDGLDTRLWADALSD